MITSSVSEWIISFRKRTDTDGHRSARKINNNLIELKMDLAEFKDNQTPQKSYKQWLKFPLVEN